MTEFYISLKHQKVSFFLQLAAGAVASCGVGLCFFWVHSRVTLYVNAEKVI